MAYSRHLNKSPPALLPAMAFGVQHVADCPSSRCRGQSGIEGRMTQFILILRLWPPLDFSVFALNWDYEYVPALPASEGYLG